MENRRSYSLDVGRTLFLTCTSICVAVASAVAQAIPPPPDATPVVTGSSSGSKILAFDVVSIRPSNAPDNQWNIRLDPNGDEYRALGLPLAQTILIAYFPRALQSKERLSGAPGWVWNDKFDFVAKVAFDDVEEWHKPLQHGWGQPNPMLETMLQAVLADRCKLVVHRIPATVPGFALVVANHGPELKRLVQADAHETIPDNAQRIPEEGRMVPILSPEDPVLHFYGTSMASLAALLSRFGAPVEDRTGLTGKYDFALTRFNTVGDPSVDWNLSALGLKLAPIRVSTETIVIDHIERPSPN
jgi:uncharacterized protein (TIGR03435 family)